MEVRKYFPKGFGVHFSPKRVQWGQGEVKANGGDKKRMHYTTDILNVSDATFDEVALETFCFQAVCCPPYREYLHGMGVSPEQVCRVEEIPFMPIEVFKYRDVYVARDGASYVKPQAVFTSSGATQSRHSMRSLAHYEATFTEAFRTFYGHPDAWSIYGLLPGYLERPDGSESSLIYMVRGLGGKFYLYDHDRLLRDMATDPKPKILLGVSYALWDLADTTKLSSSTMFPRGAFDDTIVMETGGMKGHRKELPRAEFHRILCDAFGVEKIHSEYGMAELTSQAYSQGGGVFRCPPWMRVLVRDVNDPLDIKASGRGGLNVIDLANRWSCSFIQTQDMGVLHKDGTFEVDGRIEGSDIRGCNLLIQ